MKNKIVFLLIAAIVCTGLIVGCDTEDKVSQITLTFDANGGTVNGKAIEEIKIDSGSTYTAPTPVLEEHDFMRWNDKADGTGEDFSSTKAYTGDATFFAIWEKEDGLPIILTFDANGGYFGWKEDNITSREITLEKDESLNDIAEPVPHALHDDSELIGWNTRVDGSGEEFSIDTNHNADKTFYAIWSRSAEQFTPWFWGTFDDRANDSGSSVSEMEILQEVIDGEPVTVYHYTGTRTNLFQYGYLGGLMMPNEDHEDYDALVERIKTASGFSFKVTGDGKRYQIMAVTSDIAADDHSYYRKRNGFIAPADGEVATVEVIMSGNDWGHPRDLGMGWGNRVPFDNDLIEQFQWQTDGEPTGRPDDTFWLKMWDFQLIED